MTRAMLGSVGGQPAMLHTMPCVVYEHKHVAASACMQTPYPRAYNTRVSDAQSAQAMHRKCRSQLLPMPGSLGTFYQEECGGTAHRMGKPDPIIYEIAMHDLGLPPHEVLAVGDSTEHDIAGAAQAGIDSLFVCGGIHEHDFDAKAEGALVTESGSVNERALSAMFGAWDDADRPRFAMRRFAW